MGKTASMPVVFSQIHRLYLLPSMQDPVRVRIPDNSER
jgi:hypothetical protein